MSLRNIQSAGISTKKLSSIYNYDPNDAIPETTWVRNPLWPTVTEPAADGSEEKFVGLHAVWFNRAIDGTGGLVALEIGMNTSATYDLDWGDGTTITTSGNVEYEYDVDNTNLYDAAVTFTDSGDLVTRNGHHYSNGDTLQFYNIQSTTGVSEDTVYYVINATTNTFQISTTEGGSAVTLTTDGTASLLPYKIAIVTLTPTSPGDYFTRLNFTVHSSFNNISYGLDWLDIIVSLPNADSIEIRNGYYKMYFLERIKIIAAATQIYGPSRLFGGHINLRVIECPEDMYANATNFSGAFSDTNIEVAPYLNTSNADNMESMFNGCRSLITIPAYDTSNVINMRQMLSGCTSLLTIPFINTSSCTDMYRMFYASSKLKSVPTFETSNVTSMQQMFISCSSLEKVQSEWDMTACTNASQMFNNCNSLKGSVSFTNCGNITTMNAMFSGCYSINAVYIDGLSTSLGTNGFYQTFSNCTDLTKAVFTNCNTSNNTSCFQMFNNCLVLEEAPELDTSSVTNMREMFFRCFKIKKVPLYNTVNVTTMQNMFNSCTLLQTLPKFDLTSCTILRSFVQYCESLLTLPLLDTSGVVDFNNMVSGNRKLRVFPAYDMSAATSSTNTQAWGLSNSLSRIQATGIKYTINIGSTPLNSAELNEVYTNLATVSGQTITVTGCRGVDADDPTIATAKGWTVVG
jgi:surface protein